MSAAPASGPALPATARGWAAGQAPLVSVIVPTYNCARYVGDAIESVLRQSYAPFEIVAVDDGSTDDTLQELARFGPRLRVFTQPNRGPAAARNLAVRESKGDYLAFLDGDDLWLPQHLATLMGHVGRHPELKVLYGDWLVWHPADDGSFAPLELPAPGGPAAVDADHSGWLYSRLLLDCLVWIVSTVMHRSVFDAAGGFDEELRTGSDYDFWLRVSRQFEIVKLRAPVAVYRQNAASVTHAVRRDNNPYRIVRQTLDRYGPHDGGRGELPRRVLARRLGDLAWHHGYRHFWQGDAAVAAEWFARAWQHDRWRFTAASYLCAATLRKWGRRRTGPLSPSDAPRSP